MKHTLFTTLAILPMAAASLLAIQDTEPHSIQISIMGIVIDDATGAPVAGAEVGLTATANVAVTNTDGEYALVVPHPSPPGARLVLTARAGGYADASREVDPTGDAVRVNFRLRSANVPRSLADEKRNVPPVEQAVRAPTQTRRAVTAESVISLDAVVPTGSIGGAAPAPYPAPPPGWNREAYAHIVENAFQSAAGNPLSTFSIDVDRASYSNVRRFLLDGRRPPTDAVRIEELVNYFPYAYPRPDRAGGHPFAVATEVAAAPWRPEHRLLRISLASTPIETTHLPPSNLVFLLDVSGSMNSPDKLPLVKRSLCLLVDELRPDDRVAIVVYAGAAGLVLPSTTAENRSRILGAIEELEAGGSTAGGAGLRLAYQVARENHIDGGNNRVILATDGDFNVGPSSDSEMIRLIEGMRDQGTFLTVLGFGTGNLQDAKMERIADHGNGNYAYIDTFLEARKVLVSEIGGTLLTVAKDVKLQVEFNPARVRGYRLIGYENRLLAAEDFNDDTKDAGELGAGHAVTALYEIVPVGVATEVEIRGTDPLRYQTPPARPLSGDDEIAFVRVRYKPPTADTSLLLEHPVQDAAGEPSTDFRFASAVAAFGMILRDSEHSGSATLDGIESLARGALGADEEGHRAEFLELVRAYRSLEAE